MQLYMLIDAMIEISACLSEGREEDFVWWCQQCAHLSSVRIQVSCQYLTGGTYEDEAAKMNLIDKEKEREIRIGRRWTRKRGSYAV